MTTSAERVRYMARALLGYVGNASEQVQALEIARLRARIRELEAELTELRDAHHASLDPTLDLELHQLAEGTAALA